MVNRFLSGKSANFKQMEMLFKQPDLRPSTVLTVSCVKMVVGVAVVANVWKTYDYAWPETFGEPQRGMRVVVPLGRSNRKTSGIIVYANRPRLENTKLKAVIDVIDRETQFDENRWKLGTWISKYYMTPLGMTLAAMIPSSVGKYARKRETTVFLAKERKDWPTKLGTKQKQVLCELYEARKQGIEPLGLKQLMKQSQASKDTVNRLKSLEFIRFEVRDVTLEQFNEQTEDENIQLNEDQKAVLDKLSSKLDKGFSVSLLQGVTGSGKTEVYVRAIHKIISQGKQALVMVPEIALATQTLQRLVKKLPRVAVLHSGLTDAKRAFYFQQIYDGHASVIVGPRSAVFAPARNLGLVIVDEEHELTYKQDNTPRYHGRDVAVMLGSISDIPVILGSATPSLESARNAREGKYELMKLPRRVKGLAMPKLQVVNLRNDIKHQKGVELIGQTLTHRIAGALDRNEQIILLMNRRGYASYVFCPKCQWQLNCDQCDRTMVFHQATQLVMCHYCNSTASLPEYCPACKGKILLFGMGIQRIESELSRKFPMGKFARVDSDTMTSPAQFKKVFSDFSKGELDILLGTQIVAKGLDFPRVSLVGIISADTSLSIPDFRASERTFQLIVQVSGRAGRAEVPGQVVVQTLHAEEPSIVFATTHDYDGFSNLELTLRREAQLPPYSRMVRFVVRHHNIDRAEQGARQLAEKLHQLLPPRAVLITGPQKAGIIKIRNQFRFEILLTVNQGGLVQKILNPKIEEIIRENSAEIIVDVDPVNLV